LSGAILRRNAGTSSLKFAEAPVGLDDSPEAKIIGAPEDLSGRARFRAKDSSGAVVGERVAAVCGALRRQAEWLGIGVDKEAIAAGGSRISKASSRGAARAAPTDEEPKIGRHTRGVASLHTPCRHQAHSDRRQ